MRVHHSTVLVGVVGAIRPRGTGTVKLQYENVSGTQACRHFQIAIDATVDPIVSEHRFWHFDYLVPGLRAGVLVGPPDVVAEDVRRA